MLIISRQYSSSVLGKTYILIMSLLYISTLRHYSTFFFFPPSTDVTTLCLVPKMILTLKSCIGFNENLSTWSSCKKNNDFTAFYIFSCRGFGSIFLPFHPAFSLLLAYSHCMLSTVSPCNDSTEQNTKFGISTYTIAI